MGQIRVGFVKIRYPTHQEFLGTQIHTSPKSKPNDWTS